MNPFADAWGVLKALPEQQMFTEAPPRENAAEPPMDYDLSDEYPEIDETGARSHGTVHPAIYGLLQRLINEENQFSPDTLYPDLNLDVPPPHGPYAHRNLGSPRIESVTRREDDEAELWGQGAQGWPPETRKRFWETHPTQDEKEYYESLNLSTDSRAAKADAWNVLKQPTAEQSAQIQGDLSSRWAAIEEEKRRKAAEQQAAQYAGISPGQVGKCLVLKDEAFSEYQAEVDRVRAQREQAERELAEKQAQMTGKTIVSPQQPESPFSGPEVHPERRRMEQLRAKYAQQQQQGE
jgi:hypothetical protein